jgi:cytochrome b561
MSDSRYTPWIRRLHWLVFVLVACALVLIYLHGWLPKGSALRANAKWAHMQFGMAILLVMLPRLLVRSRGGSAPPITPKPPPWQTMLAKTVHAALYVLLFGTPMLGIATMAWSGKPWNFLGIPLPSVPVPDRHFSHQLEHIHETCGNILMYLAAAHALAALVHHFFQRDDALKRMLPPARDSG